MTGLIERHWRTGPAGYTHAYLSTDPRALPSCATAIRYGTTEPAVEGIRRCKTCQRNFDRAQRHVEARLAAMDRGADREDASNG